MGSQITSPDGAAYARRSLATDMVDFPKMRYPLTIDRSRLKANSSCRFCRYTRERHFDSEILTKFALPELEATENKGIFHPTLSKISTAVNGRTIIAAN